jgi:hypothetical protein
VTVKAAPSVALPGTLTLAAAYTDDGLPKPAAQKKAAVGQETPLMLQGGIEAPVNVPSVSAARRREASTPGAVLGPTVGWMVWRGPAGASFDPANSQVKDGQAQTVVSFSKPGEYVLRAIANDRALTGIQDVTVTVTSGASASRP